ncbi:hypothetical protein J4476_04650 [Candidatus Woesearchaeota archaeon]|nr:hypothetical protein [Candidatus Woesearchaeota archaeon]HIH25622.1 hypothetical protein [Nanoarchaeota archaeon]
MEKKSVTSDVKTMNVSSEDFNKLLESTEKLVNRVDKLVGLFEEASKHVGEVESTEAKVQELAKRLETLLEQNRIIAQGLVLLEKYVRGKTSLQSNAPENMQSYQ